MTFTGTKAEINQFLFKLEKDIVYDVKIEKHREKRGLRANKYAWKLITEISRVLTMSKDEVYTKMLSDYGVLKTDEQGMSIEGYFSLDTDLKSLGAYWYFVEFVDINGGVKRKCLMLKGSSEYNSKEMYDFIQGIEQEAKALGIETLEERETRLLIEEMEGELF